MLNNNNQEFYEETADADNYQQNQRNNQQQYHTQPQDTRWQHYIPPTQQQGYPQPQGFAFRPPPPPPPQPCPTCNGFPPPQGCPTCHKRGRCNSSGQGGAPHNAPCPTCRGAPPPQGCYTCGQRASSGRRNTSGRRNSSGPQDAYDTCPQCNDRPPPNGCTLCGQLPCSQCKGHPSPQGCHTCLQRACITCNGRPNMNGCTTCNKHPCAMCRDRPPHPQCNTCGRRALGPPPPPLPCAGCMNSPPLNGCRFCNQPYNGKPRNKCSVCNDEPPPQGCPACYQYIEADPTPPPSTATPTTYSPPPSTTEGPTIISLTPAQLNEYADISLEKLSTASKVLADARRLIHQYRNDRHTNYLQWQTQKNLQRVVTPVPEDMIATTKALEDNITRLDKILATLDEQMKDMDTSKAKYNLGVILPPDTGIDKIMNSKNIRATIPEYYEKHPTLNLHDYLQKLLHEAKLNQWSYQNIKDAIGVTTSGEPYHAWDANQHKTLPAIIKQLENEFSAGGGMKQYKQEARDFTRMPGEELRACVSRFQRILAKTELKIGTTRADHRAEIYMEQMLAAVCSDSAKTKIHAARLHADREGLEFAWTEQFKIAEEAEDAHQDKPMDHRPVNIKIQARKAGKPNNRTREAEAIIPEEQITLPI